MKLFFYHTLILMLLSTALNTPLSAQYAVNVKVNGIQTSKAYLFEFIGSQPVNMVDSAMVSSNGIIQFTLDPETHPGMYRLVMGRQNWLDFVFNRENIRLETHFSAPVDSLQVIQSEENTLWSEYMNFYLILNRKQEFLHRLQSLYSPTDPFYQTIQKEMTAIRQTDPETAAKRIIQSHPESYVARFLKVELSPEIPPGLGMEEELAYVLNHFFDSVDFRDSDLIYSPPLMAKVNSFFGLYQQAFPPEETEERMIDGLNRLLSVAAVNDTVYDFLIGELIRMFENAPFETFFAYFTENFLLDGSCKDEEKSRELEDILASIKKTEIGIKAPEMVLPLTDGPVILSEMDQGAVLIVFWASWCPHCTEMLPHIHDVYAQYKPLGLEVIAVSLDSEAEVYEAALRDGNYGWINYSELKGWDCSIAYDYGIRATPTMILLNREGVIIAKPRNVEVLERQLNQLLR